MIVIEYIKVLEYIKLLEQDFIKTNPTFICFLQNVQQRFHTWRSEQFPTKYNMWRVLTKENNTQGWEKTFSMYTLLYSKCTNNALFCNHVARRCTKSIAPVDVISVRGDNKQLRQKSFVAWLFEFHGVFGLNLMVINTLT